MVDAGDSKSPAARCVGSSPTSGTRHNAVAARRQFKWRFGRRFRRMIRVRCRIVDNGGFGLVLLRTDREGLCRIGSMAGAGGGKCGLNAIGEQSCRGASDANFDENALKILKISVIFRDQDRMTKVSADSAGIGRLPVSRNTGPPKVASLGGNMLNSAAFCAEIFHRIKFSLC